jgi:hypothetical protein
MANKAKSDFDKIRDGLRVAFDLLKNSDESHPVLRGTIHDELKKSGYAANAYRALNSLKRFGEEHKLFTIHHDRRVRRGGLKSGDWLKVKYWIEYIAEPESNALDEIAEREPTLRKLSITERRAIIQARIGQGQFRGDLLKKYGGKCAVTGVSVLSLLRASHIKPWRDSTNEECLNTDNGILLVANLDAAFDAGLISFSDSGAILFDQELGATPHLVLGIKAGACLTQTPSHKQQQFLALHRSIVFLNS